MTDLHLDAHERAAWTRLAAMVELLPGVLDSQLRRDAGLTHFEYMVLAILSETPENLLRMSALAAQTSATLPRLSHVVTRLEKKGLLERRPCPEDGRASNVVLTGAGREAYAAASPGHISTVRHYVLDAFSAQELTQVARIADAVLTRIDPDGSMTASCRRAAMEAGEAVEPVEAVEAEVARTA